MQVIRDQGLSAIWRFREKQRIEMHRDSANTEFFAPQDVADRLVREAVQNTLDAADQKAPVEISFRFWTAPRDAWGPYFKTLWPHLEVQEDLRERLPRLNDPIPCLLVEDFGTTGLTGQLLPDDAQKDEASQRLFWFFMNDGRTSKSGEKLGSFGIGKNVFPSSSRINTFFGLTIRGEAPHTVLLGSSYLKEHCLNPGVDLDPCGFYALHGKDSFAPICDPGVCSSFVTTFGLTRGAERGLSIVIPYPEEGLNAERILEAATKNFFLPILAGHLIVRVEGETSNVRTLSQATLMDSAKSLETFEKLRPRIGLGQWALESGEKDAIDLKPPAEQGRPEFSEEMIPENFRSDLSARFLRGEKFHFRVPTPVERKKGGCTWSHVDVFLTFDPSNPDKDDHYVREGLTLVDHSGHAKRPGVCAILNAGDKEIASLLRASENVAHTSWRQRTPSRSRLSLDFERGPSKVKYVLGIVPSLVQILMSPEDSADAYTLADLFPRPADSDSQVRADRKADEGRPEGTLDHAEASDDSGVEVPDLPPSPPRPWKVRTDENGLSILGNSSYRGPLQPLSFSAAYGVFGRRSLARHSKADFSFIEQPGMIQAVNAHVEAADHNELEIRPHTPSFRVEVRGFDPHRALDYRVRALEED